MNISELLAKAKEIDQQIASLQQQRASLHPYLSLEAMSNKQFGTFSEEEAAQKVFGFTRISNAMERYDLFSEKLGRIEVKATRKVKDFTFNQVKPVLSDYCLFIIYDIDNLTTKLFFVPSSELYQFSMSHQHQSGGDCYTLSDTKHNRLMFEKYQITWEELNGKTCT